MKALDVHSDAYFTGSFLSQRMHQQLEPQRPLHFDSAMPAPQLNWPLTPLGSMPQIFQPAMPAGDTRAAGQQGCTLFDSVQDYDCSIEGLLIKPSCPFMAELGLALDVQMQISIMPDNLNAIAESRRSYSLLAVSS